MTMAGSKLLIFGGHVAMGDIWALDLMSESYIIPEMRLGSPFQGPIMFSYLPVTL
jgi:hypothetical protein